MLKYINIDNILLADNINKTIYKNILDLNLLNNSNMLINNNDIRNNKYDDRRILERIIIFARYFY